MVRMARSRAWIVVLATLLVGIVALNVVGLSVSSSVSRTAAEADLLERDNSLLREQISTVNTRRGARAAERAALAASTVPLVPETEISPAPATPAPDAAPAEEPVIEPELAATAVGPVDQAPSRARADQAGTGGAGPAGGVGSP